jgi:hypothetical protein
VNQTRKCRCFLKLSVSVSCSTARFVESRKAWHAENVPYGILGPYLNLQRPTYVVLFMVNLERVELYDKIGTTNPSIPLEGRRNGQGRLELCRLAPGLSQ